MTRHTLLTFAMFMSTAAAAAVPTVSTEEPLLQTMGVIFLGAFAGALFGLMNQEVMGWKDAWRFVVRRWLFSQVWAWPAAAVVKTMLPTLQLDVPRAVMLICVAFTMACPRDVMRELGELAPIRKLLEFVHHPRKES